MSKDTGMEELIGKAWKPSLSTSYYLVVPIDVSSPPQWEYCQWSFETPFWCELEEKGDEWERDDDGGIEELLATEKSNHHELHDDQTDQNLIKHLKTNRNSKLRWLSSVRLGEMSAHNWLLQLSAWGAWGTWRIPKWQSIETTQVSVILYFTQADRKHMQGTKSRIWCWPIPHDDWKHRLHCTIQAGLMDQRSLFIICLWHPQAEAVEGPKLLL